MQVVRSGLFAEKDKALESILKIIQTFSTPKNRCLMFNSFALRILSES